MRRTIVVVCAGLLGACIGGPEVEQEDAALCTPVIPTTHFDAGRWRVASTSSCDDALEIDFGAPDDWPVPGDYLGWSRPGRRRPQIAVVRPETLGWFIRDADGSTVSAQFGAPGDLPVPGDYLGLGRVQIAVYRPATSSWFVRRDDGSAIEVAFGGAGDLPVPGDYFGLGRKSIGVYRPSTGEWFLRDDAGATTVVQWGGAGELPLPRDYLRAGREVPAVFHEGTATIRPRRPDGTGAKVVEVPCTTIDPTPDASGLLRCVPGIGGTLWWGQVGVR